MSKARRISTKPAHTLLEESVALLRSSPGALLPYYIGAVPFWLGFLYFFSDMSQSAYAKERLVGGALLLALLYLWKKCWQTVFATKLRAALLFQPDEGWSAARVFRLVSIQAAWQPWGLILRPLTLVITLPFVWVSSFFQNVTVLGDGRIRANGESTGSRAWAQAQLWPGQAHLLVGMLSLFGLFVWLNVVSAMAAMPALLKMFFDIETAASRNMMALLFNSTFLSASFALAVLCFDPIWKAAYVLRCFQGESLRTGEDLLVELKRLERPVRAPLAAALAGLLLVIPLQSPAQAPPQTRPALSAAELERSIERVLQEREYAWRMPRAEAVRNEPSFITATLKRWVDGVKAAAKRFVEWIESWFKDRPRDRNEAGGGLPVQEITYLLVGAGILLLAWTVWTVLRNRSPLVITAQALQAVPDLNAEDVVADQLPVDGWLRMMQDLLNAGELRLALRAAYLATLAHLAQRELLAIARYKSNRDYQRELQRRARSREALLAAFEENLQAFERSWYGQHEVTRDLLARFSQNLETIRAC